MILLRLALLLLAGLAAAGQPLAEEVRFTEEETAFILSHGPWPPASSPDPSNRFSGNPAAIAWGKELLADTRLSKNNDESCLSCHEPFGAFADGKAVPNGLHRNTIALANLAGMRWYGWTGSSDTLWGQSILPILDPEELAATPALVAERIRAHEDLRQQYQKLTGAGLDKADDTAVLVVIAKAMAAYQETLVSPRTKFDRFRDALEADEAAGIDAYQAAAKRGLKIFAGSGKCSFCHFGPAFTNGEFHDIGRPFFIGGGKVDPGRYQGIKDIKASPFTRAGKYADRPDPDAPSQFLVLNHRNWGEWRVPSLRNVAHTAPYMHDGSLETLEDVVRHYSEIDMERLHTDGESLIQPLRLTEAEIADLVAFLETLSGTPRP